MKAALCFVASKLSDLSCISRRYEAHGGKRLKSERETTLWHSKYYVQLMSLSVYCRQHMFFTC